MRSLDSVTFDAESFSLQGDDDGTRIWWTPAGDGVGLYYFHLPPDIPADVKSVEDVRAAERSSVTDSGSAIIEVDTLLVDGCDAIRQIIKVPQEPTGMTYVGSITIPFRDFSYVIKIQCEELGITGLRESEVLSELIGRNEVSFNFGEEVGEIIGWAQDLYDPSIVTGLVRNKAEAEEYDVRFPQHPLSRLRPVLNHIQHTLKVSAEIKNEPRFEYSNPSDRRPWWKLW